MTLKNVDGNSEVVDLKRVYSVNVKAGNAAQSTTSTSVPRPTENSIPKIGSGGDRRSGRRDAATTLCPYTPMPPLYTCMGAHPCVPRRRPIRDPLCPLYLRQPRHPCHLRQPRPREKATRQTAKEKRTANEVRTATSSPSRRKRCRPPAAQRTPPAAPLDRDGRRAARMPPRARRAVFVRLVQSNKRRHGRHGRTRTETDTALWVVACSLG